MDLPIKAIEIINIHTDWRLIRYGLYKELALDGNELMLRNGFININILKERISHRPISIKESDIDKSIDGTKFLPPQFVLIQTNIDNEMILRVVEISKDSIIIDMGDQESCPGVNIKARQVGLLPLGNTVSSRARCKKIAKEILKPPSIVNYNNDTFILNKEGRYEIFN